MWGFLCLVFTCVERGGGGHVETNIFWDPFLSEKSEFDRTFWPRGLASWMVGSGLGPLECQVVWTILLLRRAMWVGFEWLT